jgi:hypothetical protein
LSQISPYANLSTIGGAMTFGGGGANALMGLGGSPSQALSSLGGDYASAYQSALQANQTMYNNILGGYQSTLAQQVQAEQQVSQGYNQLYGNVMNTIQGADTSTLQAIQRAYAQQSGSATQQMVNAGLGNTTVQQSVQSGLTGQYAQAQTAARNQFAQLQAGYQSQLGLAGLNYANQAIMQNTAEANQQLGFMNSVMMPYPNAGMYGQLAQGYGMLQAAMLGKGMLGGRGAIGSPTFGPTGGYQPYNQPSVLAESGGGGGGIFPSMTMPGAPTFSPTVGNYYGGGDFAEKGADNFTGQYSENYGQGMYDLSAGIGTS